MLRRASSLPLELPLDPAGGLSFGAEPGGERAASVVGELPSRLPRSRPTLGCPPRVRVSALASSGLLALAVALALALALTLTLTLTLTLILILT